MAPKIDELRHYVQYANPEFVCLTETWLKSHIPNSVVDLNGYNLARNDRQGKECGGVCIFIKDSINFSALEDLSDQSLEVLWLKLRPNGLPRGFSELIIGTVYHTPKVDNKTMLEYLIQSLSSIEAKFPNCGTIVLGDFDQRDTSRLRSWFDLKNTVPFPTRGPNYLDKVSTNLNRHYCVPTKLPPFGLSDHDSVEVRPLQRSQQPETKHKILSCDQRTSARMAMSTYLQEVNIPEMLDTVNTCEGKLFMLEMIVKRGLDFVLPLKSKTIHSNEPPWISRTLKDLIKKRQKAPAQGHVNEFKQLRNRVNRVRKLCRSKFYAAKVQHLKGCQPSTWWKEVKKICGMTPVSSLQRVKKGVANRAKSNKELANIINASFLAPMSEFDPLPQGYFSDFNANTPTSPDAVFQKLSTLNPYKAHGADNIPNWILRKNADILSRPVSDILNCSYCECRLPQSWKEANVVPLPKQ